MKFGAKVYTIDKYNEDCTQAKNNQLSYWENIGNDLQWMKPFTKILEGSFEEENISWFEDGTLNASVNCLDRHIDEGRGDRCAFFYQSEKGKAEKITYGELLERVCQYANVLKKYGAKKGDRAILYMPMGISGVALMLACARLGVIHSVVFAGFSSKALAVRINDLNPEFVMTANSFHRGGKTIPLYDVVIEALNQCQSRPHVILSHHNLEEKLPTGNFTHLEEEIKNVEKVCTPVECKSTDPLFVLYTSGSTGQPKGVLHTHGGYLSYVKKSFQQVFDYHLDDVFWCTADIGWITGHSYVTYGPLMNCATSVLYEGGPATPDWGRFWKIVDDYKVSIFYTAPTAVRSFMAQGDDIIKKYSLESLRLLGSVGEPLNPEAYRWYSKVIGKEKCPIVDTWWQTETGGIILTPLVCQNLEVPGAVVGPLPGVNVEIRGGSDGALRITTPWPGMTTTLYNNHKRYVETYFRDNQYHPGDRAQIDSEGNIFIGGRLDDVINVSGHRLGTAEIESALVAHEYVSEAAVVSIPHKVKGEGIVAYVIAKGGTDIIPALFDQVGKEIGKFARPEKIIMVSDLPKTRSGKIMRRILRQLAKGEENFGDLSTLAVPQVIDDIRVALT